MYGPNKIYSVNLLSCFFFTAIFPSLCNSQIDFTLVMAWCMLVICIFWLYICFTLSKPYLFIINFHRKQISIPVRVQGLEAVKLIAVGAFHNLALQENGALWAWGNNEYGQLGTGDTQPRSQAIPVQGLSGLNLVCFFFLFSFFLWCFCFIYIFSSFL